MTATPLPISTLRGRLSQAGVQRAAAPGDQREHRVRIGVRRRTRGNLLADLSPAPARDAPGCPERRGIQHGPHHRVSLDRRGVDRDRVGRDHLRQTAREWAGRRARARSRSDCEGRPVERLQAVGGERRRGPSYALHEIHVVPSERSRRQDAELRRRQQRARFADQSCLAERRRFGA